MGRPQIKISRVRMQCECNDIQCRRFIELDSDEYMSATDGDRVVVVMALECALSPGDELKEARADYKLVYAGDE